MVKYHPLLLNWAIAFLAFTIVRVYAGVRESGALTTAPKATAMLPLSSLFASTGGGADRGGLTLSITMGEWRLNDKGGGGLTKGGNSKTTTAAATAVNGGGRGQ